jgi:hypothetical protein
MTSARTDFFTDTPFVELGRMPMKQSLEQILNVGAYLIDRFFEILTRKGHKRDDAALLVGYKPL